MVFQSFGIKYQIFKCGGIGDSAMSTTTSTDVGVEKATEHVKFYVTRSELKHLTQIVNEYNVKNDTILSVGDFFKKLAFEVMERDLEEGAN